jgi:Carboxypeptidase regulatory-like domain
MRAAILLGCLLIGCATAPRPAPMRTVELPPVPPITHPDPAQSPAPGRIERDAAIADRFTAEKQSAAYAFDADAGELSLFSLMTWGYARGWHSLAHVRIRDASGVLLHEETRKGGAAWFGFTSFVAPRKGSYRYEIDLEEGYFRYRLARYSSYRDHASHAVEPLPAEGVAHGYLKTGADHARYSLHVAQGELVALKVLNAEEDGRKERRTSTPVELMRGMQGGLLHAQFRIELVLGGEKQPDSGHYALWRAPRAGKLVVDVLADAQGDGGRFELALEREPKRIEITGTVVDRDDEPRAGVELEFLLGADSDPVGTVVTDSEGRYAIQVPPGPYRIRLGRRIVQATAFEARTIDLRRVDDAQ